MAFYQTGKLIGSMVFITLLMAGCSKSSETGGGSTALGAKDLPALTSEEKARFEVAVDAMGSVTSAVSGGTASVSTSSSASSAAIMSSSTQNQIESEILAGTCQTVVNSPVSSSSGSVSFDLSVAGSSCPISLTSKMNFQMVQQGATGATVSGSYVESLKIISESLSGLAGLKGRELTMSVAGNVSSSQTSTVVNLSVQATGSVESVKEGLIGLSGSVNVKGTVDNQGNKNGRVDVVWKFELNQMTVMLESHVFADGTQKTEQYLLNSQEITKSEFESYLSRAQLAQHQKIPMMQSL